jgi:uncharacterized integral membrane protein (TIGR00698 family)
MHAETPAPKAAEGSPPPRGRRPWAPHLLAAGAIACLFPAVSPALALIGGIALALLLGNELGTGASRAAQLLLKVSVVGLGAGMNLGVVWRVGVRGAGYTAISIAASLALGLWLSRRARLQRDVGLLISVGTAICGGSAIAAVAGVIRPRQHEVSVAFTTVFLLNAVALVAFPPLGHLWGFTPRQFGLWAALAIHDTSSVVGAALSYDPASVPVATTVKLARALWIVPVAMAAGRWRSRSEPASNRPLRLPVPLFILGFIAAAAVFTYAAPLAPWRGAVSREAQRLFAVTLFLIGSGFSRAALATTGLRPLGVGVALWFCAASGTAVAIGQHWIR